MALVHLSDSNFEKVAASHPMLVIEFYGQHCQPCKQISPFIAKLAVSGQGKFDVAQVDVAAAPAVVKALGVQSTPTVLITQHGNILARYVGLNEILFRLKSLA